MPSAPARSAHSGSLLSRLVCLCCCCLLLPRGGQCLCLLPTCSASRLARPRPRPWLMLCAPRWPSSAALPVRVGAGRAATAHLQGPRARLGQCYPELVQRRGRRARGCSGSGAARARRPPARFRSPAPLQHTRRACAPLQLARTCADSSIPLHTHPQRPRSAPACARPTPSWRPRLQRPRLTSHRPRQPTASVSAERAGAEALSDEIC